jgi:hypothetical protein
VKHPHVLGEKVAGLALFFNTFCPVYVGMTYRPLVAKIKWDGPKYSELIRALSPTAAEKRALAYLHPEEIERVATKLTTKDNASIRFGFSKSGKGYKGERGDFCLIGGAIRDGHLTVFYRRLELVNGWAYDVVMLEDLHRQLRRTNTMGFGETWKTVQIMAVQADIYVVQRTSAEEQYEALKGIYNVGTI